MTQLRSFSQKLWQISSDSTVTTLPDLQSILLENRGLTDHETIQNFLEPSLENLESPWEMKDMKKAVERIKRAIENDERIIVFGDFDTDGITATVILAQTLKKLGAHVSYRIPDRTADSHGLKTYFLDDLAERNVSLVITVDCGINDSVEVSYAKERGIDVIITDHHESDAKIFPKDAVAVLNPKVGENGETSPELAGAAVAWKLAAAISEEILQNNSEKIASILDPLLELVAIGIIADCVELVGENRIFAKFGLEKIKTTSWKGLLQLLERTETSLDKITEESVGFVIAPHLNAASRIGDVLIAAQLFLGNENENLARIEKLLHWNNIRRELTEKAIAQSAEQIRPKAPFQIFYNKKWKPGILGLLAARHSQQLGVPTVACTLRKDGKISASCRAPEGYSIIDGLRATEKCLEKFGGHAGAAGFFMEQKNFEELKKQLDHHFSQKNIGTIPLKVDAWVSSELLNEELINFLKFFAPFGNGNPAPILGLKNVKISNIRSMGKQKNHARIIGEIEGRELNFIAFFARHFIEQVNVNDHVDIAITIGENEWNGKRTLELRVIDIWKK